MDYLLNDEQRGWQKLARQFAEDEIRPISVERDQIADPAATFDWDIIRKGSRLGFRTLAVDRDAAAIASLNEEASRRGVSIQTAIVDLENGQPFLAPVSFDLVVVVHYLHRPLFPSIVSALRPGGVLVYETFTRAQAARGKPTNPAFLLEEGELLRLVQPLEILASREGDFEGHMVAGVVAVKR